MLENLWSFGIINLTNLSPSYTLSIYFISVYLPPVESSWLLEATIRLKWRVILLKGIWRLLASLLQRKLELVKTIKSTSQRQNKFWIKRWLFELFKVVFCLNVDRDNSDPTLKVEVKLLSNILHQSKNPSNWSHQHIAEERFKVGQSCQWYFKPTCLQLYNQERSQNKKNCRGTYRRLPKGNHIWQPRQYFWDFLGHQHCHCREMGLSNLGWWIIHHNKPGDNPESYGYKWQNIKS